MFRLGANVAPALALCLIACEHEAPSPAPAPSASQDPHATIESVRRTMADSSQTMADSQRIMKAAGETMRKMSKRSIVAVVEYPLKGERLDKARELCHRKNGDVKFRGDWGPFVCWSREPDCEPLDSDAGSAGMCSEGGPVFELYQVPTKALY